MKEAIVAMKESDIYQRNKNESFAPPGLLELYQ